MNNSIIQFAQTVFPKENIRENEPMSRHTTFKTGGAAEIFIEVENAVQLTKMIPYLRLLEMDYFILGNGSNLLVSDKGYQGVILQIGPKMGKITSEGGRITAQAGAPLAAAARAAQKSGLTGLEFASGIPGTVGGAVVMNAGAYGGEMEQLVESVTVLNKDGELMELDHDTMEFGYRTSILKNRPFIVLETLLRLEPGNEAEISAKMEELGARRRAKQPLEYPSAGSAFKRPEGYYAGKLIMDAGLRGFRIGGAQVSEKHCGFLINAGGASATDIYDLMQEVRERVYGQFGVLLEPEVITLGEF